MFPHTPQTDPICPSPDQQKQTHQWCTFEAYDNQTIIIQNIYLVIVILVFGYVVLKYRKLVRYKQGRFKGYFGDGFVEVYRVVGIWAVVTCLRVGVNIGIFYGFMYKDFQRQEVPDEPDPEIYSIIVASANIFTLLNFTAASLINLLCILIPYQFFKVLLLTIQQSQLMTFQLVAQTKKWLKLLNIVRIYFKYLRKIFIIVLIIEIGVFYLTEFARCSWAQYNYYYIVGQAILTLIFYIFVRFKTRYLTKNQLFKLQSKDHLGMRFKYGSFLLVIIVRIVINLFYSIVFAPGSEVSYHPNGNCSNMGGSLELSVLLGCHHFFMHLVPVWVVLYMFQVRIKIKKEGGGGGSRGRELEEDARSVDSQSLLESDASFRNVREMFYKTEFREPITPIPKKIEKQISYQ